jgi:hypothetical protein
MPHARTRHEQKSSHLEAATQEWRQLEAAKQECRLATTWHNYDTLKDCMEKTAVKSLSCR